MQQLIEWNPLPELDQKASSFGDIAIVSPYHQRLSVVLEYGEGALHIEFNDVRAFMTSWDGDPDSFLTHEEAISRPSDLCKVEASRWLASGNLRLDVESSLRTSQRPWEHFYIVSGERSLHVAARDDIEASWVAK